MLRNMLEICLVFFSPTMYAYKSYAYKKDMYIFTCIKDLITSACHALFRPDDTPFEGGK